MNKVRSPLSDDARKVTGDALQQALIDLIDLGLVAKQAHWNLTGRNFRSVHLEHDKVIAAMTDLLAEITQRFRAHIEVTDATDLVSQDLLIATIRDLEEQHWMFEVQRH